MTSETALILVILIINFLIAAAYIIINIMIKTKLYGEDVIKIVVMVICPLVGAAFFLGSHIFYRIFYKQEAELSDVVFSKERIETHLHADEEQGLNVVPLEEALAVSDTDSLRLLVMNVVRGDVQDSLASIALALNSEDSETSHYAASVLQDALNNFRMNVQKIYNEIKRAGREQTYYAAHLIDYMNDFLIQKIFTDMEQRTFVMMMDEVGDILYGKDRRSMTSHMFEAVCMRLLEIKEFEYCDKWCRRGIEEFPNTLSSYTCFLKLYFTSGQRDNFFEKLDELKKSNIVIDNETLELIRVFG